jgi:RAD51-like protein 2
MLTSTSKVATGCAPVDRLLNGGLSRGHILEISGPPGSAKEQLAINFVRSFVEVGDEVLFVGMRRFLFSRHVAGRPFTPDSQNMTSPATLNKALSGEPSFYVGVSPD